MKRKKTFIALLSSLFSIFALNSLSFNNGYYESKAEDEWQIENAKMLVANSVYNNNGNDSYYRFSIRPTDYDSMPDQFVYLGSQSNYNISDYNFLNYIELSSDNENYISFSTIYNTNHTDYLFKNGDVRLSLRKGSPTFEEEATYQYIRILEGCEFPSYQYVSGGVTKKKYVQENTTISKLSSNTAQGDYSVTTYSEVAQKRSVSYNGIAAGWNNANYGDPSYNHLIISFGEHGVDYLNNSHTPDPTNQAKESFDIGKKLTINGLPIYKINEKYTTTSVDYAHGFAYFHVVYPVEVLLLNKNNMVPTLHIENKTEFLDVSLPELTLKLVGNVWIATNNDEYRIESPLDIDDYYADELPQKIGNESRGLLVHLPLEGCKFAFSLNSGDIDLSVLNNALIFDGFYGCMIVIYPASGTIQLIDHDSENVTVQQFTGLVFSQNTNYTIELEVTCDESTNVKFAISHLLVINYTFDFNKSKECDLWSVDTSNAFIMDYYHELESYKPSIIYGGSSIYDFMEGDPIFNFANVVNAFDLYDDSISSANLTFDYEEGAVSDNKYNEGTWTLTISLDVDGHKTSYKEVTINVHGKTSIAKIYYDDGEAIEVPIGSLLTPPPNPSSYREGDYDYIFDGWYFEGAKWDFENDTVQGDMHLYSRFKQTNPHYIVTVIFEGIERNKETYSLTYGTSLPFSLFEMEGATYEVYYEEDKISSLVVTDDITIKVKYTIIFSFVPAKEATCTEDGNLAYWYSAVYKDYYFADAEGREIIEDAIIPKFNHDIIHLEYLDSTCTEIGHIDCYYCSNCHKHYSDENAEYEIENWMIEKKPHVLTHHDEVKATCLEGGNVEYWTCANEPGVYYGNIECTLILGSVIVDPLGHDYRAATYTWVEINDGYQCLASIKCSNCLDEISETQIAEKLVIREATCSTEGQISYSVRFNNERFSAQNKLVTIPKTSHKYVHVEEIKATLDTYGVKEHYECEECHKCFTKNNDEYNEVEFNDLVYVINDSTNKKCGGNIAITSLLLFTMSGTLSLLLILRRKEDR